MLVRQLHICFVCGQPIKSKEVRIPAFGRLATMLQVQPGTYVYRHERCNPSSEGWASKFGTSEINELLRKSKQ